MADDESEGDLGTSDTTRQPTAFAKPETTHTRINLPVQNCREIWNTGIAPSNGPRSLLLKRCENGFGFTLRHFIVYPPESSAILARDRRLGLDVQAIENEPMDTIFVKHVRESSPASAAGLTTGDRIISVNGTDIAGLSYARVIQLIHKTGNYLHLLVVPKENDILQLYFSETAHNPETNQRFRVHSPEMASNGQQCRRYMSPMTSHPVHHYSRCRTSPLQGVSVSAGDRERITSPTKSVGLRRSSEGNNEGKMEPSACLYARGNRDVCSQQPISDTSSCCSSESGLSYSYATGTPTCRYSLDVGIGRGNNYDSLSDSSIKDSYGSDDSLIMSRLRKSFEQKEEFMNRLPEPVAAKENEVASKEFYGRPQKLSTPAWPPLQPSNVTNVKNVANNVLDTSSKTKNKQNFVSTLDRIQESTSAVPSLSKINELHDGSSQPFQLVTIRTQQFEKGPIDNKTELYRSELARLTTKHNVANVATRKRDFEKRAQQERRAFATRETRSLESANIPIPYTSSSSGNRIIPIGSKNLHCEPPSDFVQLSTKDEEPKNTDLSSQKNKPVVRQDSYLAACRKPTIKINKKQDGGEIAESESISISVPQLRTLAESEDDKSTRRISYIKATGGDPMNVDSEYEISDSETIVPVPQRRTTRKWRSPLFPGDIQKLRRFFEDLAASSCERGVLGSRKTAENYPDQDLHSIVKEGAVLCKVTQVDGKRAGDRSWKPIWLTLRGPFLYLCKERRESLPLHSETPATFDKPDLGASCDRIDIRCSVVEVACDYTKRKHVFRLNAPSVGAELLLQADDANSMAHWVSVLQEQSLTPATSTEPLPNFVSNVSPNTGNKTLRNKLTSLRNRSPTGDSPNSKTRKSLQNAETQQTSPKSRNWRNKILRRIQPSSSSANTPAVVSYPPGATIGIPLEACPCSTFSEYVPLLVEICTAIVEAKGLEIIGIYRVPGNTAAVTSLTEAVNRGFDSDSIFDQDPRWSDVNVISSLLKSFFRKLPDALLTGELYPHFIKSDRIEDPILRMVTIRKLVHDLPDHNFETLKYLLFHLKKIVANSTVNKMEARNLAIVFGPTLVRNGDDMVTMVTDMSHQCRIVESLLCHVDWCFGDGNLADLKACIPEMNSVPELEPTLTNRCVLLGNIRKVEGSMQSAVSAKDIMSTIIGAANRKMHKTSKHLISNRKTSAVNLNIPSGSIGEDRLDSAQNHQDSANNSKILEKDKENTKNSENETINNESINSEISNSVTISKQISEDLSLKTRTNGDSGNTWTYSGLSETTQERIRRFEQETKAMLQRELTRQKRLSNVTSEDLEREKLSSRSKDEYLDKLKPETRPDTTSEKPSENKTQSEHTATPNKNSVCDNPPPVVVMRRNLPNTNGKNVTTNNNSNNLKRLKTGDEFVRNNSLERSGSLDSLNRVGRPSSHVSDDGGDLLMSLTNTFDKKLKSLLTEKEEKMLANDDNLSMKKRYSFACQSDIDDYSSFRDPSLHRTFEKATKPTDNEFQKEKTEMNKENGEKCEKTEAADDNEKRSCATCGCSLHHTEMIRQNCDNWKRTVLQETHAENRLQENVRREPKLFYSSSVKLRRSESLKEDGANTKLHRSGSLNKHEAKMSKIETWMLTRNAEAIKLKRTDSLTKSEKTETNMMKRRQMELNKKNRADKDGKLKRRNGTNKNGNIKRRHTVGGTKDFDKVSWLQSQQRETNKENRKERRTSSPDLSSTRMADFFIEVVVRPRSVVSADPNFISRLLNIPLESHV